jgi:hypothetical protein
MAGKNNTVNLILPLPDVSLDGTGHRAHHRGIDFMYEPNPKPGRAVVCPFGSATRSTCLTPCWSDD